GRSRTSFSHPSASLARAAFARYPLIPLAEDLHRLIQSRIVQELFHFRACLARGGTLRAFGQSPHQHGSKGGIVFGLLGIYSLINVRFGVITRQVRSPFLLGDEVGNTREE